MYTLIEHKELESAAASITFSSIPQTYTDLVLVYALRTDRSATDDSVLIRFNSATTNFTVRELRGTGSGVNSNTFSVGFCGFVNGASSTSSTFSSQSIYIPNYANGNNKSFSVDGVFENNATSALQGILAGLWSQTNAITSITLVPDVGPNFVQYSSATLYGINRTTALGRPKAIGGAITYANGYWVHTFTGSGTFAAQEPLVCEYVIVGGGGGPTGGFIGAGGAGAGGYRSSVAGELSGRNTLAEPAIQIGADQLLYVTVGAGGAQNSNGTDSTFGSITAIGGGRAGQAGGSGGGVAGTGPTSGGAGTTAQGFNGGSITGMNGGFDSATGGGGAGAASGGVDTGGGGASTGGNGIASSITGTSVRRAGGGGGMAPRNSSTQYAGGLGGGGTGLNRSTYPTQESLANGAVNTGGGAGGLTNSGGNLVTSVNGGSGIVIIRYMAD